MKIRIFAVVMAVLCLTVCMCIPALAATNIPVVNGQSFSASHWTDDNGGELRYLEIEHGVTYTITVDPSITKLDLWVYKTASRANASLTFVDGVCEYVCDDTNVRGIVILCGDAENRPTVTVSWPQPPILERLVGSIGDFVGGFFTHIGGPTLEFITSHGLTLVPALAGLAILGILLVRKFVYGA